MNNKDRISGDNPKVNVLLSAYNGELYIEEQIDSILKQENVDIHLYVRDDGSSDSTILIIDKLVKQYKDKIELIKGENLGFANSFMYLVDICSEADYYAFADQDDIWKPNKLIVAIKNICVDFPMLYASNLNIFNMVENRNYMLYTETQKDEVLYNMEHYCYMFNPYGCTMVWNNALQSELKKYKKPKEQTHDVWVNIIAHYTGKMYFDFNSYINYRVHGKNACGVTPNSIIKKIKKYFHFYFIKNKSLHISCSCQIIDKLFKDKTNKYIHNFASYKKSFINRMKAFYYIGNLNISKSAKNKYRLLIIFGKF